VTGTGGAIGTGGRGTGGAGTGGAGEPSCEITCQTGENLLCGDLYGCKLFCYSTAWTPDPGCPAVGCPNETIGPGLAC